MKNIKKELQESLMNPILKIFGSNAKCEKDVRGNYFWLMQIANNIGVMAGITFRLEHESDTHSGILISVSANNYEDEPIYNNKFKFTSDYLISEINKIIESCELDNYYIL